MAFDPNAVLLSPLSYKSQSSPVSANSSYKIPSCFGFGGSVLGSPTSSVREFASPGGLGMDGSGFGRSILGGSSIDASGPGGSDFGSHDLGGNVFGGSRKSSDLNKVEIRVVNRNDNGIFEDVLAAYLSADAKFKSAESRDENDFDFESLQLGLSTDENVRYDIEQHDLVYVKSDGSKLSITRQRQWRVALLDMWSRQSTHVLRLEVRSKGTKSGDFPAARPANTSHALGSSRPRPLTPGVEIQVDKTRTGSIVEQDAVEEVLESVLELDAVEELLGPELNVDALGLLSEEDRIETIARRMQNPALGQLTFENWESTCDLFKITDRTKTKRADKVRIMGSKLDFMPYQLLGIWFMITRGTIGFRGGILADDPRIGRTAQIMGLIMVKRWLFLAGDDVQLARNSREPATRSRHLPASTFEMPQPANAKCPSQDQWGVQCPCVESGVSASILPTLSRGPTLAVLHPGTIKVWSDRLVKFADPNEARLKLEWFVYHPSFSSPLPDNRKLEVMCDSNTGKAPIHSERIIFITTPEHLYTQLVAKYRNEEHEYYGNSSSRYTVVADRPGLSWGLMIRDDLTYHYDSNATLSEYFADPHHQKNKPERWALARTTFETSPEDLSSHIRSFESPNWSESSHTYYLSSSAFMKKAAITYKKITSGQDVSAERGFSIIAQLNRGLARFMIRRTETSNFFGQPVLAVLPYKVLLRECPIKAGWVQTVARVEADLKAKTEEDFNLRMFRWTYSGQEGQQPKKIAGNFMADAFLLRLCGGFPEFATMLEEDPELSLHSAHIYRSGWAKDWRKSPFYENRDRLAESSQKFAETLRIIQEIQKKEDPERREKFVVLSFNPATAVALQCCFAGRNIPSLLITSSMPIIERTNIITKFCQHSDQSNKYPGAAVLISTTNLMGTARNLTRVATCILFEPDERVKVQQQCFWRVHRTKQTEETNLFLLWDPDNSIERCLISGQRGEEDNWDYFSI